MVQTELTNRTDAELALTLTQVGTTSSGNATVSDDGAVLLPAVWDAKPYTIRFDRETTPALDGSSYQAPFELTVPAGGSETISQTQSLPYTEEEQVKEAAHAKDVLADTARYIQENRARWDGYIAKIEEADVSQPYKNAAVKSVITLMGSYRSAKGKMPYGGIHPFRGGSIWPWDSWKHAVATSRFNPELAKEEIRAHYFFQIQEGSNILPLDAGTLCDTIGANGIGNSRNTKPPLSAWAIYNYYEQTGDKDFIVEMYPKLVAYHQWWYTHRDIDHNGIAEYGAMVHNDHYQRDGDGKLQYDENGDALFNITKVLEAAAWESGMDNATRFDIDGYGPDDPGIEVYRMKDSGGATMGYTLNQESVDLNAYLYAEKCYLSAMARLLEKPGEAEAYEQEAESVRDYVNTKMFDADTGFYYDLQTNEDGSVKKLLTNRGKGTEGWIPLWARMATPAQAQAVAATMLDENKFYTPMPFPTASRDNPKYSPTTYWRGPVWMDQAMFAVEALHNYGFDEEASAAAYRLFDNAGGLLGTGPIRENYNPETGGGLHASNFGWSSAAFYNLFLNSLSGADATTSQKILPIPEDGQDEYTVSVAFPAGAVELAADGVDIGFANLTGSFAQTLPAGEAFTFTFTPRAEGRAFAAVSVNGSPVNFEDAASFIYEGKAGESPSNLQFAFTVVDKGTLNLLIDKAEACKDGDEYAAAVGAVKTKLDKALEAAQKTSASKTATQEEIDRAWKELLEAIQYLSFEKGDLSKLEALLALTADLQEEAFTAGSWLAYQTQRAEAEALTADPDNALAVEVEKAHGLLLDAIEHLERAADRAELDALIARAEEIAKDIKAGEYLEDGQAAFQTALDEAKKLDRGASQKEINAAAEKLVKAMADLRRVPSRDELKAYISEIEQIDLTGYTDRSAANLFSALHVAKAAAADENADGKTIAKAFYTLEDAENGLEKANAPETKPNKKSGGSSPNKSNTYGAAGTAVANPLVAAAQSVSAKNAYVVSDTTANFTLKRGQAYCFKMTVANGNGGVPSFTVGNGNVLKTQFVAQTGSDYYYRVYAAGIPGKSTGVYTALPGQNAVKHCTVTIA